jgi:hypothetical protein
MGAHCARPGRIEPAVPSRRLSAGCWRNGRGPAGPAEPPAADTAGAHPAPPYDAATRFASLEYRQVDVCQELELGVESKDRVVGGGDAAELRVRGVRADASEECAHLKFPSLEVEGPGIAEQD